VTRRAGAIALLIAMLASSACSDRVSDPPEPEVARENVELNAAQRRALDALATTHAAIPGDVLATEAEAAIAHGGHGGHAPTDVEMTPELDAQLDRARDAATTLAQQTRLSRDDYFLGVNSSNGVGTHYINWELVGGAFDPARPAMLLVDDTPGHPRRLAGFSYWVRSDDPPEGFAGDADVWHHHLGLCFENAVLTREWLGDPADCAGDWLDGRDLWMLHAWVAPGFENPDGVFAATNPDLSVA
jgi:hypothetical protein